MLQDLALAAFAWSAVIPPAAWDAAMLNPLAAEQCIATRPSFSERVLIEELVPGERVSIRLADAGGGSQCVTGCVEEVAEGRIVLGRAIAQEVKLRFLPAPWAERIPYVPQHWGTHLAVYELDYLGVSVIPVATAAEIGPAEWRDWIVQGPLPYRMIEITGPNAWHPSPREDF